MRRFHQEVDSFEISLINEGALVADSRDQVLVCSVLKNESGRHWQLPEGFSQNVFQLINGHENSSHENSARKAKNA
jgi:hypothetical protein